MTKFDDTPIVIGVVIEQDDRETLILQGFTASVINVIRFFEKEFFQKFVISLCHYVRYQHRPPQESSGRIPRKSDLSFDTQCQK